MNIIKMKSHVEIPQNYTGVVEWEDGDKRWYKNSKYHREDGPVIFGKNDYKSWYLDGNFICNSNGKLDLTNKIVLSKSQHPEYPLVQVWKILGPNGLYRQIVIPGMEEYIKE